MNIYQKIKTSSNSLLAVLIDPDKISENNLKAIAKHCNLKKIDFLFVGGSIVSSSVDKLVEKIKNLTDTPVVIFPGSPIQISYKADAVLFLSLISGRNPELLIGQHIQVSKRLKKSKLEVIPTGYMLIKNKNISSVEYISNTKPIPAQKTDIAISTAIAGELLGLKTIYLEAGSGASETINENLIKKVKENINIPLIVGGGIKTKNDIEKVKKAGADIVVIGTVVEKNINFLENI